MYTKMIKSVFEISVKMPNYWLLAKHVLTIEVEPNMNEFVILSHS